MSTEIISFNNVLEHRNLPTEIKRQKIKTMIMKKSSKTCAICIEGFK